MGLEDGHRGFSWKGCGPELDQSRIFNGSSRDIETRRTAENNTVFIAFAYIIVQHV